MSSRYIRKQAKELIIDPISNVSCYPVDGDIHHWKGILLGPNDSIYEDGIFNFDLYIPFDYPFKSPRVIFETAIFHPNIDQRGRVHIDILKDMWSPAITLAAILRSISSLLDDPLPEPCANLEAGKLYLDDLVKYRKMVRECVIKSHS